MSARGGGVRNAASSSQGQRHAKKLLAIVTRQLLEKKKKRKTGNMERRTNQSPTEHSRARTSSSADKKLRVGAVGGHSEERKQNSGWKS